MIELTLNVGDKLYIGGDVVIEILEKTHPKAIPAQVARIGIKAPKEIEIQRSELLLR